MRLPRLSRKQKIIRNLLLAALSYFLMMWYQGFPVRSREVLLQRAAGAYLIEEPVELLYVHEAKNSFVYGLADGRLLRISHGKNPFYGMQLNHQWLYPEGTRYILSYDTHDYSGYDKETTFIPLRYEGMLIGLLEEAATAELDILLVRYSDAPTREEISQEIVTITGVREGEYNLYFPAVEDSRNGMHYHATLSALRLYDEAGNLLGEKDYEEERLLGFRRDTDEN